MDTTHLSTIETLDIPTHLAPHTTSWYEHVMLAAMRITTTVENHMSTRMNDTDRHYYMRGLDAPIHVDGTDIPGGIDVTWEDLREYRRLVDWASERWAESADYPDSI